ncbi:MAG: FecR domain-containing protein [Verrucomicrobia bacterium]|nr:FecR domain-containing protein [Verrucomicrobiota bacterium]
MKARCERLCATVGTLRQRGRPPPTRGNFRLVIDFQKIGNPAAVPIHFVSRDRDPTLKRELQPPAGDGSRCRRNGFHFSPRLLHHSGVRRLLTVLIFCVLAPPAADAQSTNRASAVDTNLLSRVIEAAGKVEYAMGGGTNWQPAAAGQVLKSGDRLRTRVMSRAAVQLSDRSVIRLNERTTLEILPPRSNEKRRFGLSRGSLYFFNREKPADVEFDTPLAAGAIRGTEFLLEVVSNDTTDATSLHLALIDGRVALQTRDGELALERGQDLRLQVGKAPQKTALVNATAAIQWALYYPAVVNPAELQLTAAEQTALAGSLSNYRAGDLLAALDAWPATPNELSAGANALRAQLELAVGRVAEAEQVLAGLPSDAPAAAALRELIAVVRGDSGVDRHVGSIHSASELLAHSYARQAQSDLPGALAAARKAASIAPQFGFALARLAELEFSFGHHRAALAELDRALALSPRLATAHALRGFVLIEQGDVPGARESFDHARELDAAFGPAWLGRGLCRLRERQYAEARAAFQAAAALEPQRALFRAYLGKAASALGDAPAAEKEFGLAKQLDANDPTAWLYSALHLWQENRLNEAIRDLERSSDLNDQRAPFRSRLLLDGDRSVRSANLAALYDEVGVPDASRHAAAQAVSESYANFSGHLFLANSFQTLEDVNRFDLRLETARQSELLVANLLAPPGAGNLSQLLSQQEHLQFFDQRPVGVSSLTEYTSRGDWRQSGTAFGTFDGFSYAFDANYESLNGQRVNNDADRRQFILTAKQRVTADDEAYFQIGDLHAEAGDVADHYDPAQANPGFRVKETQEPTLYAGWHHAWSPGSHTLLLVARLDDRLTLHDPLPNVPFLRQVGGVTTEVQSPQPFGLPLILDLASDFTLYSAELQHVWETPKQSLVIGGRWQSGDVKDRGTLNPAFGGPLVTFFNDQNASGSLQRGDVYAYGSWQILDSLRLIGGVSYDHIQFPENMDLPPVSGRETSRDLVSPKAGLLFTPWERGLLRASYAKSLGGLYFDNSVRLEPTQIGGFNQAFRSLIPESVAGLVPGTEFETAGVGFDQSLASGTWFGVEAEWLTSRGSRAVGVVTNSTFLPFADSPSSTSQTLDFRERSLSAYAGQLLGDNFSVGARYRLSEATLMGRFPQVPDGAANLDLLEQNNRATLHQLSLTANFHHRSGVFAQWESAWYLQSNSGYTPSLAGENLWQHNLMAGYRFPRRHAEIRLGLLNLFDTDYRLNPLNLHSELPRSRTFTASVRLNF